MPALDVVAQGIVPFPAQSSYYYSMINMGLQFLGMVANLIVFSSNVGKSNSESAKLLLSLVACDFIFGLTCFVAVVAAVWYNGFGLGVNGCIAICCALIVSTSGSVITLAAVALERYLSVVKGVVLTQTQVLKWLACIWIYTFSYMSLPFIFQSQYQSIRLEESGQSCLIAWYGRDPPTQFLAILGIFVMSSANGLIMFCYKSVYETFVAAIKQSRHQSTLVHKERKIFHMCLFMTGSFTLLWTPMFGSMLYELISGKTTLPEYSNFATFIGTLTILFNPIALVYFDNRIRAHVIEFLHLSGRIKVQMTSTAPSYIQEPSIEQSLASAKTEILPRNPNATMT
jgi:hypothetical protein